MSDFISADISKISKFEKDSADAITEFNNIKDKFNSINSTLLSRWEGAGATAYKSETDHILENIGGIKDILDSINNSVVKDIRENYSQLDEELGEFNRNPKTDKNSGG